MKTLLLLTLLTSCGFDVKIRDFDVNHKVSVDLDGIKDFCEGAYDTNEEIDQCIEDLRLSLGLQQ
jgi:hypothetical protein